MQNGERFPCNVPSHFLLFFLICPKWALLQNVASHNVNVTYVTITKLSCTQRTVEVTKHKSYKM
jgi:hypothetical protein